MHSSSFSSDREPVWFRYTNQVLSILTKNSLVRTVEFCFPARPRCKKDPNGNRDDIAVMSGRVQNQQKQNGAHSSQEDRSNANR